MRAFCDDCQVHNASLLALARCVAIRPNTCHRRCLPHH